MPNTYGNRIKVSTSTTGTGTITLGSAVDGFQSFSSGGITDGNTVAYVIEDGSNFEIGTGTYTASGTTLTRTVSESNNSNNAINLSGDAVVFVAPSASDLPFTDGASFSGAVTFAEDVTFDGATAGYDITFDRSANSLKFQDNVKAKFGFGNDLEVYHASNSSYIDEVGGGSLFIRSNGPNIFIGKTTGSEYMGVFTPDGAVSLRYDNATKFETTSSGINVTGTVTDDGAVHDGDVTFTGASYSAVWDKSDSALEFADNAKAVFGTGGDLQLYHNASNSVIGNYTGSFFIVQYADDGDIVLRSDNGSGGVTDYFRGDGSTGEAILYHYGNQKIATKSTGVDVTGSMTVSGTVDGRDVATDGTKLDGIAVNATANPNALDDLVDDTSPQLGGALQLNGNNIQANDSTSVVNNRIQLGTSQDLQLYHAGTDSHIYNETGNLVISNAADDKDVVIKADNGSGGLTDYLRADASSGQLKLSYYGSTKLYTASSGIQVNGYLGVTGNIGVQGTVDGRDIAADGTKLDGIATGANVGIPTTGGTFTGDVTFNEDILVGQNDKVWLGYVGSANQGLQLFHGGTSATIENHNFVTTYKSDGHTFKRHSTDREYMTLNEDTYHTVSLKASGTTRLQTSSSGVDVTGNIANTSGNMSIKTYGTLYITDEVGTTNASFADGGAVVLYNNHMERLRTNTTGVSVTGTLSATAVTGDGSGLTNLPAGASNVGTGNFIGGTGAGDALATGGDYNTLLGQQAGNDITTGDGNVAVGANAGASLTTGTNNVLIGRDTAQHAAQNHSGVIVGAYAGGALNSSGGASNSVAVGYESGGWSQGGRNTYLGYESGKFRTTGNDNTAIGNDSQRGQSGQTTMTSALPNTSVGSESLFNITTGLNNVVMGYRAGRTITSGGNNIIIGNDAGYSFSTQSNNIAIGTNAAKYSDQSNSIAIGYNSMGGGDSNANNNYRNIIIGYQAGTQHDTGENTYIGYQSGYNRVNGSKHTAIGYQSQYGGALNTTYSGNTSVGYKSLYSVTTGYDNVALGRDALLDNSTGNKNIGIGSLAGENITTGFENIAIGHEALGTNTTSNRNTAVGYQALYTSTTGENAAFGWQALRQASSGSYNTAVGANALSTVSTGYYNTALGRSSGDNITTGYNNIVIGYNASASSASVNNEVTIGDSNITRFRVPAAGIDNTSAALSGTTPSVDVSARDTYTITTSGNTTFTFTNPPSSPQVAKFTLILTAGGTHTLTWPTSVDWAGGSAPSAPASGEKNIYTFMSIDGGTNWYGFLAGAAFA
jgi:hypothetical protein